MRRLFWVGLFAASTTVTMGCTFDPDASAKEVNADGADGSPSDPNQDPIPAPEDCVEMGGDPMECAGMPGGRDDEPTDCWPRAFEDCLRAGGCEERCAAHADELCGSQPPPPPMDDCWPRAFEDCLRAGGCEERCAAHADELCGSQPPPPPMDDCWPRAFQDCLGWGGTEEDCAPFADQLCYADLNQPPRFGQP